MNEKQINELLEQIYGEDKVPAEFDGIVKAFSKRKSSIMPSAPTMSEVVMLTVLFDLLKDMTEARKDDESDEDIANDLRGAEPAGGGRRPHRRKGYRHPDGKRLHRRAVLSRNGGRLPPRLDGLQVRRRRDRRRRHPRRHLL